MNDDTDDIMEEEPDRGLSIMDVKAHLENVFKGCQVVIPTSLGGSFHAEVSFFEYEIRVILSGKRAVDRKIHYRFQQRVEHPSTRKPTKRMITEIEMNSEAEFIQAVEDTKAHLMGIVFAITKAMRPPNVPRIVGIEDLFKGGG
jgi:hypothetical protein